MKTLQQGLKKSSKKNNMKLPQEKLQSEPKPKETENLSANDIKELMGMNMPTYRRGKGGSMRQR
ncbi:hypothetical protein QNH20_19245 [Neobacillus sp. WH10]|uniref:hypothetical protein n=1 Tax=Neobacillus sp. WH10 TaxID=3047873 RepID=UPI0024C1BB2F|nr:hypothetical protein [Neobacillus sp. WH10]WHY76242.1 hypothetical protein QNH20_19245 [Neobacillus sp. WH10]